MTKQIGKRSSSSMAETCTAAYAYGEVLVGTYGSAADARNLARYLRIALQSMGINLDVRTTRNGKVWLVA